MAVAEGRDFNPPYLHPAHEATVRRRGRPVGQTITLKSRVLDSAGRGVPNTLIEIWQTNASGAYLDPADPGFMSLDPNVTGAGRTITDSDGRYGFRTIKAAAYPGSSVRCSARPTFTPRCSVRCSRVA